MHEMSLVMGILDIAQDHARTEGARVINSITVVVGELAGVEIPSLEFCFEAARVGTLAADAELIIDEIDGRGRCVECGKESPMDFYAAVCPLCEKGLLEVFQGRELRVKSLEVD